MLLKKEIVHNYRELRKENQELKKEIEILEKKLKDNIRFDENRFKELFEAREEIERLQYIIKEVKEKLKNIYMLSNVTISNNAVEKIDECIEILDKEK